jgi:hypothetical protein
MGLPETISIIRIPVQMILNSAAMAGNISKKAPNAVKSEAASMRDFT